jgi:Isoleucyl-tRNA synthetase
MAFSKDILNRSIDGFRRIRNTMRFMISNLYDYSDNFNEKDLLLLDKVILNKTKELQEEIRANYENYNLHFITSKILNFCVNDLGGMYLDIIKDRLYTMKDGSVGRRSAQFTIKKVLTILIKNISPILPFTAYEFYEQMFPGEGDKIFLEEYENLSSFASNDEMEIFKVLEELRSSVYQEIESKRQKGILKNALDAEISITLTKEKFELLEHLSSEIHKFFISSACKLVLGKEEKIQVSKSKHEKCSRCWHRVEGVEAGGHCYRCEDNMNGEGEIRSFF